MHQSWLEGMLGSLDREGTMHRGYNRKLDKQIDGYKDFDIPISSSLALGMVPLLMYEVRLLPE